MRRLTYDGMERGQKARTRRFSARADDIKLRESDRPLEFKHLAPPNKRAVAVYLHGTPLVLYQVFGIV